MFDFFETDAVCIREEDPRSILTLRREDFASRQCSWSASSQSSDLYEIGFGFVERRGLGDSNGDLVSALNQMIFKTDQRISWRQCFCPSGFFWLWNFQVQVQVYFLIRSRTHRTWVSSREGIYTIWYTLIIIINACTERSRKLWSIFHNFATVPHT